MNFSYWEKEYLDASCDFLVVGMGLTGLQTAIGLKKENPTADVVVVDRAPWSLGASTRNAGFACFANISEILDDLRNESAEDVYAVVSKRYLGIKRLRENFGDETIGYVERGSAEIFTKENKEDLEKAIDSIQAINTILSHETGLDNVFHFSSKSYLPGMIGAVHNKYEGQLNTGMLYSAVRKTAVDLGVKLLGGLEVKDWNDGPKVEVNFANSWKFKTGKLLLCTNAFTQLITDEKVAPARGQVVVSERFSELPCTGLHHYDKGYYYWRDIDNRILLGGARNLDVSGETSTNIDFNEGVLNELKRFLNEQIAGRPVKIDYQWSGIMGVGSSNEKTPIVKAVSNNVYVAARLGGMGVALSSLVSEDLLELLKA